MTKMILTDSTTPHVVNAEGIKKPFTKGKAIMDRIRGVGKFNVTSGVEGSVPVGCIILSARAAVFAIKKSRKQEWFCHIAKLDPAHSISYGYLVVGFSPVTGCMVAVKESELTRFVNLTVI